MPSPLKYISITFTFLVEQAALETHFSSSWSTYGLGGTQKTQTLLIQSTSIEKAKPTLKSRHIIASAWALEAIIFLQLQQFSIASTIVLLWCRPVSSMTYIIMFSNRNSVVLQFCLTCPSDQTIEYFNTMCMQISDLAPSTRLLTKHDDSLLIYELSRIVGVLLGPYLQFCLGNAVWRTQAAWLTGDGKAVLSKSVHVMFNYTTNPLPCRLCCLSNR